MAEPLRSPMQNDAFAALAVLVDPWLAGREEEVGERLDRLAPIDWPAVVAAAERHRVAPLLAARLKALEKSGARLAIESEPGERLGQWARSAVLGELGMLAEIRRLSAEFDRLALPYMLVKGLSLSQRCFGKAGLRTNRDIDLLIAPENLARGDAMLLAQGFRRIEPEGSVSPEELERYARRCKDLVYVKPETGVVLELHHRLFDNATLCDPSVLERAEPLRLFGQVDVPAMAAADELPYLALHGAMHAWSRLKWLVDFAMRLRALDTATLQKLLLAARGGPAACAMHQGVALCWRIFEPEAVEPSSGRPWRTGLLRAAAVHAMAGSGHRELEDTRFGTTLKNVSHYLLWARPAYLAAELGFDLNDISGEAASAPRFMPIWLYRPIAWIGRKI